MLVPHNSIQYIECVSNALGVAAYLRPLDLDLDLDLDRARLARSLSLDLDVELDLEPRRASR